MFAYGVSITNKVSDHLYDIGGFFLLVFFISQSTGMVISGRSIHITTLFPEQARLNGYQYFVHIISLVTDNILYSINGRRRDI